MAKRNKATQAKIIKSADETVIAYYYTENRAELSFRPVDTGNQIQPRQLLAVNCQGDTLTSGSGKKVADRELFEDFIDDWLEYQSAELEN